MYHVKKKLSYRLLLLLMSFIVLFIVFLYSVGFTTKVQFSINSNATLMNYGNSKNSGTRSEYVYVMQYLGMFLGRSILKTLNRYRRVQQKFALIIAGYVQGITVTVKRDE